MLHAKSKLVLNGTSDNQVEKLAADQMVLGKQKEKNLNLSTPQGPYNRIIGMGSQLPNIANTAQALEVSRNSEVIELNVEKASGNKIVGDSTQGHSASILDKLFSSAVTLNGVGSSNITEVIVVFSSVCNSYVSIYTSSILFSKYCFSG